MPGVESEPTLTIISGGQTGVDRAALDAALAANVPCGGWCPRGRKAEDGRIPDRYPLREMESPDYRARTIRNVLQSDGTLIIYFDRLTGGTRLTADSCIQHHVPHLLINGSAVEVSEAAGKVAAFVNENDIKVLNVAGPRASNHAHAYDYTFDLIGRLLDRLNIF